MRRLAFMLLVVSTTVLVPTHADAAAARCTIRGTPGTTSFRGTAGADVICGLGGADELRG